MGITGLLPFVSNASRKAHVSEWSGCTVAIDAYCWLHRGAFSCADRLARGDFTDMHIKYCMKYVNMLLSHNIKPILVFDGRHLPAKAATEHKRRESRANSKKRAAELLRLGQTEEARSYLRRSVDITHEMALQLIRECRARRVDCMVAPYEADAELAYLNVRGYAHLVITEDSDLILFGCKVVLFKMDLDGSGILVETSKLPLVMKCPIERYTFDKFRRMCILSGCDYLSSLPGVGLAKARQFVTSTQDPDFANALKKLPGFLNKSQLIVTDEYREAFLRAEATFKHQYVYDPTRREMLRLNYPHEDGTDEELCRDAGKLLDAKTAFQLALGNLDPFTLAVMDDYDPDKTSTDSSMKQSQGWSHSVSKHPSVWKGDYVQYTGEERPWRKTTRQPVLCVEGTRQKKSRVLVVPETQEGITVEDLKSIYSAGPQNKRQKIEQNEADTKESLKTSPVIVHKNRSFKKSLANSSYSILKRLSKFPRTVMDDGVVESKFFNSSSENDAGHSKSDKCDNSDCFKGESDEDYKDVDKSDDVEKNICDTESKSVSDETEMNNSQKVNSPNKSPILDSKVSRNPFKVSNSLDVSLSEDVIESTYPMETILTPLDSQSSFGDVISPYEFARLQPPASTQSASQSVSQPVKQSASQFVKQSVTQTRCRQPGLRKRNSAPALTGQPTLLSKFGFEKKPVFKR